ncbi:DUF971 domain-containing protein [soil metagenome]
MSDAPPEELRIRDRGRILAISYPGGERHDLSAEYLRVESPSAEVRGHGPGQEITVPGKRSVTIAGIEPVGHYAVRIKFSDGHSTGLYTWTFLRELGRNQEARWQTYLGKLAVERLSRD